MTVRAKWITAAIIPATLLTLSLPLVWNRAIAEDKPLIQPNPVVETRTYDIRDLLPPAGSETRYYAHYGIYKVEVEIPGILDGPIPTVNAETGPSLFATGSTGLFTEAAPPDSRQEAVKSLIEAIRVHVAPETWKDNVSDAGAIREFNGKLIITQTPDAHDAIRKLLAMLSVRNDIPLQVDERILAVDQKTLSAILDLGPNLTAKQVADLLADSKVKLLAAPTLAVLSGQAGNLVHTSTKGFIQSFARTTTAAIPADAAASQPAKPATDVTAPLLANINAGSQTEVRATLSSDRSTILVKFRQYSSRPKLSPAKTPAAPSLESPELEAAIQDTTFTIPEGKYAILGGDRMQTPSGDKDLTDMENPFIVYLVRAIIVTPPKP